MVELFINVLKTARPRQWVKNLSLYAPLIFSGKLFNTGAFLLSTAAVIIFSGISSSIYFLNDIIDIENDRRHPFKKFRPIAAGKLPVPLAFFFFVTGFMISFFLASKLSFFFFLVCFAYFALQILYSFYLKNLEVLDVMSIASGFILRVYAGAIILNYHVSSWFLLCVISAALFLAVGKRRAELAILASAAASHRKTLSHYSESLLDGYLSIFSTSAWLSWALFTFFESPPVLVKPGFLYSFLPLTFSGSNKFLMLTIPVIIYIIMRYLRIIYDGSLAESPERVIFSDKPLLGTILLWGIMVILIIYGVD